MIKSRLHMAAVLDLIRNMMELIWESSNNNLCFFSGSVVEQSIHEFIAFGNDTNDQPFHEINDEGKQPFDFKQQGIVIHKFYDPITIWMDSRCSVMPHIINFYMMICSSIHEPVVAFLLHILISFHIFCCIHINKSSNLLLEIYFWKFVYA